jgi:MFS family permease
LALPREASDLKNLIADGKSAASAVYEPFGPSSFIELAEINISAPESARYFAAVYSTVNSTSNSTNGTNSTPGHYGLAVGYREEFSFSERITTPLRLISVYLWEGQSLGFILIPYLVAEVVALLFFWRGSRRTSFCLAGLLAGFLFLATSASVFTQMVFSLTRAPFGQEVYITVLIAVFNALLGVAAIRLARGEAGILQRVLLAVLGTLALLAGSGLIMGPIMAIAASFLPSKSGSIFGKSVSIAQEKDKLRKS